MRASNASTTVTAGSSRRAQPVRQTRTNPPRSSAVLPRPFNGGRNVDQAPSTNEPPGFFPAITHFTDTITALPKEVIRHLTLLKEVDAKACGPEEQLFRLVEAALAIPIPSRKSTNTAGKAIDAGNGSTAAQTIDRSEDTTRTVVADPVASDSTANETEELARRSLFYQLHMVANEMIPTLDEKIHVLSPATEALNKQLARLDSSFPYVEAEISEEARYGSLTHWAYTDKGNGVTGTGAPERQRRDVAAANNLAAAAAAINDTEAAARSELRREAMLAKRRRDHHADSDADEHHHGGRQRMDGSKKPTNTKIKRPGEGANGNSVGLGISNGAGLQNPPTKKRKTEKAALAGTGIMTERSMASVYQGNNLKHGASGSPRETPGLEGSKKRQRATPAQPGATRKRNNTNASNGQTPSLASSPIHGSFPGNSKDYRNSPAPASQRPGSSRARNSSSTMGTLEHSLSNGRQRPSSSASNRPNGHSRTTSTDAIAISNITGRSNADVRLSMKETASNPTEHMIEDEKAVMKGGLVLPSLEEDNDNEATGMSKSESSRARAESLSDVTKNSKPTRTHSRTSKTATPVTSTFPTSLETSSNTNGPPKRDRSSRLDPPSKYANTKRSHKKGAGAAAQMLAAVAAGKGGVQLGEDDGDEEDEDEPRYCYCNNVSYGEMVACDMDGCAREWFHLECVGLRKPPVNANWYCDDCKEKLKRGSSSNNATISSTTAITATSAR